MRRRWKWFLRGSYSAMMLIVLMMFANFLLEIIYQKHETGRMDAVAAPVPTVYDYFPPLEDLCPHGKCP